MESQRKRGYASFPIAIKWNWHQYDRVWPVWFQRANAVFIAFWKTSAMVCHASFSVSYVRLWLCSMIWLNSLLLSSFSIHFSQCSSCSRQSVFCSIEKAGSGKANILQLYIHRFIRSYLGFSYWILGRLSFRANPFFKSFIKKRPVSAFWGRALCT